MAKHDWIQLQADFLAAHKETGVTVQEFCTQNDLNYSSARRYIKISRTKAKLGTKTQAKAMSVNKNTGALKHGGYSKYFDKDIKQLVIGTDLNDELELCRSRVHLVICTIEEIQRRLACKEDRPNAEVAASLFESLFKADIALDNNVKRIESITKTLSSIRIDELNERKIRADTIKSVEITKATAINAKKSIKQTELIELQVKQAQKEAGGSSKIDDYIDSVTNPKLDSVIG